MEGRLVLRPQRQPTFYNVGQFNLQVITNSPKCLRNRSRRIFPDEPSHLLCSRNWPHRHDALFVLPSTFNIRTSGCDDERLCHMSHWRSSHRHRRHRCRLLSPQQRHLYSLAMCARLICACPMFNSVWPCTVVSPRRQGIRVVVRIVTRRHLDWGKKIAVDHALLWIFLWLNLDQFVILGLATSVIVMHSAMASRIACVHVALAGRLELETLMSSLLCAVTAAAASLTWLAGGSQSNAHIRCHERLIVIIRAASN